MSLNSNQANEKTEKFEESVKAFHEILSDSDVIPKRFQITLRELTDEYTDYVASLSEVFIESVRRKGIGRPDIFTEIPIVNSIENYPYPIVLLSDEQELDAETQGIVRRRRENGYVTFPVIILSDQFFRLTYGESPAYEKIKKTFEESSKEKVMVFRRSEFKFLEEYMTSVRHLCLIHAYLQMIEEIRTVLSSAVDEVTVKLEETASISCLAIIQHIKAIVRTDTELERIYDKFEKHIIEWQAEIAAIREKCDRLALEEFTHIKADSLSPFVLNIELIYAPLQGYINDFLNLREIDLDYDFITEKLKRLVDETLTSVKSNRANLSLIGTFSSGKTTLINTFLGQRKIPLRTSMGHNTAVLMHLFHEYKDGEYYDIIYKNILTWTVVRPAAMSKPVVNKENESIRIVSVSQEERGNYLVRCYLMQSKKPHSIRIRSVSGIVVKKDDVLKPGDPFTAIEKNISAIVEICPKAEIELLIKQIDLSKEYKLQTAENAITEKRTILDLLRRIHKIALDIGTTMKYEEFCERIGLKQSGSNANKPSYNTKYRRIEVTCDVRRENERRTLDKRGWIELCGDPNPSKNDSLVFSEHPECYMLAKELQLHVNAEFLQYCSLTDTPGFGSVTEEHDAITERYIRDSSGRLLVMISINARTVDAKYQDLINSIDDIYNNFRKTDKANVVFMLNCFTNLAPEEHIKNQIDKVHKMLVKYGFSEKNIFVCNLRSALVDNQQMDTMFGYPSYRQFHDFIIKDMISVELQKKYRGIQKNWNDFFSDSKRQINGQIDEFQSDLSDLQRKKQELNDTIAALKKISVDERYYDKDSAKKEFDSMYETLEDAYLNNRKGIFNRKRREALMEGLNTVKSALSSCNEDLTGGIYAYYDKLKNSISYQGKSESRPPEIPSPGSLAVLETERLKRLLLEADEETHWYDKSKQNKYYTDKFDDLIWAGFDQTINKANSFCLECAKIVKDYKESIIREKVSMLDGLENEQTMKERLGKLRMVKENIAKLEGRFRRIKFV